tara:strand:+ start:1998 stop:2234 length:237 start_codon:yes stop_codon:yes gene_type:complete
MQVIHYGSDQPVFDTAGNFILKLSKDLPPEISAQQIREYLVNKISTGEIKTLPQILDSQIKNYVLNEKSVIIDNYQQI